jgi:hypothetical protein
LNSIARTVSNVGPFFGPGAPLARRITRILRAADIFLENGVHKHAIQQTFSLCVWSPAATASKSPTPAPASSSRRT